MEEKIEYGRLYKLQDKLLDIVFPDSLSSRQLLQRENTIELLRLNNPLPASARERVCQRQRSTGEAECFFVD